MKHVRKDGRRIRVAQKFPHSSSCPACRQEKLCTKCGADALLVVNCLCTMTEEEDFAICSLTLHQVATMVSVSGDETIAYEKGDGWWTGYSRLDGNTAWALMRAGMITTNHSITGGGVTYYKLTRLGRLATIKDYNHRKELGVA